MATLNRSQLTEEDGIDHVFTRHSSTFYIGMFEPLYPNDLTVVNNTDRKGRGREDVLYTLDVGHNGIESILGIRITGRLGKTGFLP